MKYNGFYFWMFKSPMKAVLTEKYGNAYAGETMKKSKKVYRELVGKLPTLVTTTQWHTTSCLHSPLSHLT